MSKQIDSIIARVKAMPARGTAANITIDENMEINLQEGTVIIKNFPTSKKIVKMKFENFVFLFEMKDLFNQVIEDFGGELFEASAASLEQYKKERDTSRQSQPQN